MYALLFLIIVAAALLLAALYYGRQRGDKCNTRACVNLHSENGENYPWLRGIHGGLKRIEFEEPVGSGVWRAYTDKIWEIHCKIIKHDGSDATVEDHMRAFVNPATRFARLHFFFNDGAVMEPTREFYELERDWFKKVKC